MSMEITKKMLKYFLGNFIYSKLECLKKYFFPTTYDKEQKIYFDTQVKFYKQFIYPNDLCFDIGANIGLKSKIFLELGAEVVAVEPQASCIEILQRDFRKKATILAKGIGAVNEVKDFFISNNIELSSFNKDWVNTLPSEAYGDTKINRINKIELVTLDYLITKYGQPNFIKIDVEGYEAEVLKGLNKPFKLLSFEFFVENSTFQLEECLDILGNKFKHLQVNFSSGNAVSKFNLDKWLSVDDFKKYILTTNFKSTFAGDIYVKMI